MWGVIRFIRFIRVIGVIGSFILHLLLRGCNTLEVIMVARALLLVWLGLLMRVIIIDKGYYSVLLGIFGYFLLPANCATRRSHM